MDLLRAPGQGKPLPKKGRKRTKDGQLQGGWDTEDQGSKGGGGKQRAFLRDLSEVWTCVLLFCAHMC